MASGLDNGQRSPAANPDLARGRLVQRLLDGSRKWPKCLQVLRSWTLWRDRLLLDANIERIECAVNDPLYPLELAAKQRTKRTVSYHSVSS